MLYNYLSLGDINKWPKEKFAKLFTLLNVENYDELLNKTFTWYPNDVVFNATDPSSPLYALNKFTYVFNGVSQEVLDFLVEKNNEVLPVDLLFFDCPTTELNGASAFEIKMGGNLDTKNARSNAEEVKSLSDLFGFLTDHSAYFATCYGECSAAVRSDLEAILGDNTICNNRTFWDKIIPSSDFTYEDFIEVYTEAFRATNLEEQLGDL